MVNTYSTKPFISYDGADENGVRAEVKVVTGYGTVSEIESSKAGKSFKISFAVENTQYFPSGWAPDGSNVLEKIRKAEEGGEPIHFRIETRRKNDIDRTTPIADLTTLAMAKDSIFKSIAAVKFEGDEEWTISPNAVTRLDEDPVRSGGLYRAYDQPREESAAPAQAPRQGGGLEPPPYVTHLRDGEVNPGSIAASVPLNLLSFVAEWDRDHATDPTAVVGEKKRAAVAKVMLMAANELQLAIWDGKLEKPDLGAGSHTRARALVFEVTRMYFPLTAEVVDTKESLMAWKDGVVAKALAMWKWSITEVQHLEG